MIDFNLEQVLRERIASEVDIAVLTRDMAIVHMPLVYNDGDHLSVYLERLRNGNWRITDQGDVANRASYVGANLSDKKYSEKAESIANFYGASVERGTLGMEASDVELSDAVFTFTQVCLETSWLYRSFSTGEAVVIKRTFPQRLWKLIDSCIPSDKVTHNYHDAAADPKGNHPVDYRIEGKKKQLFLFGVWGAYSCMRATIACQHFDKKRVDFESVVVYRNEEKLSKRLTEPLNEIVTRRFPRVSESEQIRRYLKKSVS